MATKLYLHTMLAGSMGSLRPHSVACWPANTTVLEYYTPLANNVPTSTDVGATLDQAIGTTQTSMGKVSGIPEDLGYHLSGRFVSSPLAAQTISGTIQYVGAIGHTGTTGFVAFGATMSAFLYRPSTGQKFKLWEGYLGKEWTSSLTTAGELAGTGTIRTMTTQTAKKGDAIIVEVGIGFEKTVSSTLTTYWDGTTEGSNSNNAAYINFGNTLSFDLGAVDDEFVGAAGTALASHSPEAGGAWSSPTVGWQTAGAGYIAANAANCRSIITAGANGEVEIWDRRLASSGEMCYLFRYSDSSNYWYVKDIQNGNFELHKVVSGSDTTVMTDAVNNDSTYVIGVRIVFEGNSIRAGKWHAGESWTIDREDGHLLGAEMALSADDSFNSSATIIGLESVTNSTSQKLSGISFKSTAGMASTDTFLQRTEVAFRALPKVVSGAYTWQNVLTIPASYFRANKSYALVALVKLHESGGSSSTEAMRLIKGGTEITGTLGTFAAATINDYDGMGLGTVVRYNTTATPSDISLQLCDRMPTTASACLIAWVSLIAICLDDLGVENTDWWYTDNTVNHVITTDSNADSGLSYDGCSISVSCNGSTPYLMLGATTMSSTALGLSSGWSGLRDSAVTDSSGYAQMLCGGQVQPVFSNDISTGTPPGQINQLLMAVRTPSNATHNLMTSCADGDFAYQWSHVFSSLLIIKLASNVADVATYSAGPGSGVTSASSTWVSMANLSLTPTKSTKALVLCSATRTNGGDGTWQQNAISGTNVKHYARLQVDPDNGGQQTAPGYGDEVANRNAYNASYRINVSEVLLQVVDLTLSASVTIDLDVYGIASGPTYDARYAASFRDPDPLPPVVDLGISKVFRMVA